MAEINNVLERIAAAIEANNNLLREFLAQNSGPAMMPKAAIKQRTKKEARCQDAEQRLLKSHPDLAAFLHKR